MTETGASAADVQPDESLIAARERDIGQVGGGNDAYPWDEFDSDWYLEHNYRLFRDDDRQLVRRVRDHFVSLSFPGPVAGIDVGAGTNLGPALLMLPFCHTITLWEYARPNLRWLAQEVPGFSSSWDPVWTELADHSKYGDIAAPRETLAGRTQIRQGSVFELPRRAWDLGTMFFVAESITGDGAEFDAALAAFLGSLRAAAPFAAAFMENSEGYRVAGQRYPAVSVTVEEVQSQLERVDARGEVARIGVDANPLRAGYTGMILATGWTQDC